MPRLLFQAYRLERQRLTSEDQSCGAGKHNNAACQLGLLPGGGERVNRKSFGFAHDRKVAQKP